MTGCGAPARARPPRRPEPSTEGANAQVKFEVGLALLNDATMAIEVAFSDALINWPYFKDLSLVRGERRRERRKHQMKEWNNWMGAVLLSCLGLAWLRWTQDLVQSLH